MIKRLTDLNHLPASNAPSDVTAIIGYAFDPGDVSKPITAAALETARAIVRRAAAEGALWLDADMGITNSLEAFVNDPAISYYPLARAIIAEAHRAGLKVFFYFSGTEVETPHFSHRTGKAIEELHPDWLQIDQNGQPMIFKPGGLNFFWLDEDTADARLTPLAPDYRDAVMTRAEAIAQLGADGIFVDVAYFFTTGDRWADFSTHSAKAFKADTGFDLPRRLERDGKVYRVWLDWRHKVWADFFAEMRQRLQQVNPQTLLIVEEYPGANPGGAVETGLDPALVDSSVDVAAHEYDRKQDEGGASAYHRADWQYTRDVYKWYQGMNRVNWCLCYAAEANGSRALAAMTYWHQQSFWETKAPTMLNDSAGSEWRQELLAWVKQHAGLFNGAQPIAEVAVVYSSRTRDLTQAASMDELTRVQHALDESRIPYAIVTEPNIQHIHDYPYVIFPGVTHATAEVLAAVKEYKGTLLLSGESFTRDGWDENDLTPPVAPVELTELLARISTTPIEVKNGDGLFVELFRRGKQIQVRLLNPELDSEFKAKTRTVTLRFRWNGAPTVTRLDFMADRVVELKPTVKDGVVEVPVEAGLATMAMIGQP